MEDLSLHILDIVENGIEAGAKAIRITVEEDLKLDIMRIIIEDDGKGMDRSLLEKAFDPFVTTRKTRRVGLGLPLLYEAAKMAGGDVHIESQPGQGTRVTALFKHSHIDRKPLGNIAKTILALIAGNPEIDFRYEHRRDGRDYILDTSMIRKELAEVPINNPDVLHFIEEDIVKGIKGLDPVEK